MKTLLIALTLCFLAASAWARNQSAPTIEWLADQSDSIGIYKAISVQLTKIPQAHRPNKGQWGKWDVASLMLELVEVKKGEPPTRLDAEYSVHPTDFEEDIQHEIAKDHRLACFLSFDPERQKGVMTQLRLKYCINLDSPASHGPHTPFSANFTVPHTEAEILSLLVARLGKPGPKVAASSALELQIEILRHKIDVPSGTPAFLSSHGSSGCYLTIPQDLWLPNAEHFPVDDLIRDLRPSEKQAQ